MANRSLQQGENSPFLPADEGERKRVMDEAVRRAREDIAAGRVVSQEDVLRWLRSWGTDQELPPPVGLEDD